MQPINWNFLAAGDLQSTVNLTVQGLSIHIYVNAISQKHDLLSVFAAYMSVVISRTRIYIESYSIYDIHTGR